MHPTIKTEKVAKLIIITLNDPVSSTTTEYIFEDINENLICFKGLTQINRMD
jgi:hypothetical protein